MELYSHQQEIINRNPARHLIAHSTGTGKTITTISLANKNCKTCLVIVPKIIKEKWDRDVEQFGNGCSFLVITKEQFKKNLLSLPKTEGVIVDEGHYFANRKSQLSKALRWYFKKHQVNFRWIATATPYLSTPWNIYSLAEHLGYSWNYYNFENEFFYKVNMGGRMIPVVKSNIDQKLSELVLTIGSVVDLKEVVDVPEQTFKTEYFDLTREQISGIEALEDTQFITRWTRTHQIENGLLYGDGYTEDQEFKCLKNERIRELCRQNKKIAIFVRYNRQLDYLKDTLKDINPNIFVLNGGVKDRDQVIFDINASESCIAIIQSQCSVGYELPTIDTIVFASLSFSYIDKAQAEGRFLRINRLKKNTYYYLVSKGVDKDVYDCIMRKEDFYIELQEKK